MQRERGMRSGRGGFAAELGSVATNWLRVG